MQFYSQAKNNKVQSEFECKSRSPAGLEELASPHNSTSNLRTKLLPRAKMLQPFGLPKSVTHTSSKNASRMEWCLLWAHSTSPWVLRADAMYAHQMHKPTASWEGRQGGGVWNYRYNLKQPVKTETFEAVILSSLWLCPSCDSCSSFHFQMKKILLVRNKSSAEEKSSPWGAVLGPTKCGGLCHCSETSISL